VTTKHSTQTGISSHPSGFDYTAIRGIDEAIKLARFGRLISAIKYIEAANPEISRRKAKALVDSFGYSSEARWPDIDRQPIRCL
jgi:hypothetical protein